VTPLVCFAGYMHIYLAPSNNNVFVISFDKCCTYTRAGTVSKEVRKLYFSGINLWFTAACL